jgi:chaperonin cofactor prefoldin
MTKKRKTNTDQKVDALEERMELLEGHFVAMSDDMAEIRSTLKALAVHLEKNWSETHIRI